MSSIHNNIYEYFTENISQWPQRIAIEDEEKQLTYIQVKEKIDYLASIFKEYDLPQGTHVGVYMPRSSSCIITIMALFAAKLSYAVLETASSNKFLTDSVEKYGVPLVVTHENGPQFPKETGKPIMVLDSNANIVTTPSNPTIQSKTQKLTERAFVVFSSGTTGEPKAIQGTQQAMLGSYRQRQEEYGYGDIQSSFWRVAAGVFFVWECIRPLLFGGTTVVIPDSTLIDPWELDNFLEEKQVNEVLMTASYLELFLSINKTAAKRLHSNGLQRIWLNGEVVTGALGRTAKNILGSNVELLNLYSISECHDVAVLDISEYISSHPEVQGPVPVGKPLKQTQVWTDEHTDEILVSGPFLSTGYLGNHPANARFVKHPRRGTYYRTGDKGNIESDSTVVIHGRLHNSVRVRGRTVVLEEVEALIRDTLNIPQCGVIYDSEAQHLCAYIVRPNIRLTQAIDTHNTSENTNITTTNDNDDNNNNNNNNHSSITSDNDSDVRHLPYTWTIDNSTGQAPEIRSQLLQNAPSDALVPGVYFEVQDLPLDVVSNKVNRTALHADWENRKAAMTSEKEQNSQQNSQLSMEQALTKAWTSCLGSEPLFGEDNDANFFEQGGDSLNVPRLVQELKTLTGKKLSVMSVHQNRTFKQLTNLLESSDSTENQDKQSLVDRMHADCEIAVRVPKQPASGAEDDKPKVLLLTGATGFLGTFVLERLSYYLPQVEINCLVRASDAEAGLKRIANTRQKFGVTTEMPKNIRVVAGSMDKPCLGLSLEVYRDLCERVDTVVHTAALVNFGCDYDASRGANVLGAQNIALFLQESEKPKAIHFISSNGCFPMGGKTARHCEEDTDILGWEDELENGYDQSKWVAERIFQKVQGCGYPVSIYRPGNIGGNSESGALGDQDFQGLIWRACIEVNAYPDLPKEREWMFESTPVNTIADFVVARVVNKTRIPGMYNLICQPTVPANTILPGVAEEKLSLQEWYDRLKQHSDNTISSLPGIVDEFERYLLDENTYTVKAFHTEAKELDVNIPAWDAAYAKRQGDFLVKSAKN